ncbi:unnamed protein product [Discula destructiva]
MSSHRYLSTVTTGGGTSAGCPRQHGLLVIRKVVKENFRGLTPIDASIKRLHVSLPSNASPMYIDPSDAVVKKILDRIRDDCEVWIDVVDGGLELVVSARTHDNMCGGLRQIRSWMVAQSRELKHTATILVNRIGGAASCITLKSTKQLLGARPDSDDGLWRGMALPGSKAGTVKEGLATPSEESDFVFYQCTPKNISDALVRAAQSVRADLGQKFVRVRLGLRTMSKKKKKRAEAVGLKENPSSEKKNLEAFDTEADTKYETAQYQALLNSAVKRGHSSFHVCFGNEELTRTILQHVYDTDDSETPECRQFVPLDATVERLEDVKPHFCLVFFSAGLRIEMDIHFETSRNQMTQTVASFKNKPTASTPRVFRFNKTVDAEIVVACPEKKVDWQISVESDLGADSVHDKFRTLATELRFEDVEEGVLTFPVFKVSRAALLAAEVDGVACKVYHTFECLNAPYHVEIATYYDWNATPLSAHLGNPRQTIYEISTSGSKGCATPNKSCAVSLYGDDWDYKMSEMNPASATFSKELVELFYDRDLLATHGNAAVGELSAGQLIREVALLLDITSQAVVKLDGLEVGASPGNSSQATIRAVSAPESLATDEPLLPGSESLIDLDMEEIQSPGLMPVSSQADAKSLLD